MASILVIDDNSALADLIALALRSRGHSVGTCPDGKAGIKYLDSHPVDLVITDIVMPEQDGLGVLMELRRRTSRPKIIVMLGEAPQRAPFYLSMGEKLGATSTLLKPFSIETLLRSVSAVLGSPEAISPAGGGSAP